MNPGNPRTDECFMGGAVGLASAVPITTRSSGVMNLSGHRCENQVSAGLSSPMVVAAGQFYGSNSLLRDLFNGDHNRERVCLLAQLYCASRCRITANSEFVVGPKH
jgi:hypothetical protein